MGKQKGQGGAGEHLPYLRGGPGFDPRHQQKIRIKRGPEAVRLHPRPHHVTRAPHGLASWVGEGEDKLDPLAVLGLG